MRSSFVVCAVAFALSVSGCPDRSILDCKDDILGCQDNGNAFPSSPVCTHEAELEIKFGHGMNTFTPISNTGQLPLEHGPQGGFHTFVSVQIKGVDLEKSPLIKVTIAFEGYGSPSRVLTIGAKTPIVKDESGFITVTGIMVFTSFDMYADAGAAKVEDMCGNTATDLVPGWDEESELSENDFSLETTDDEFDEYDGSDFDDGSIFEEDF